MADENPRPPTQLGDAFFNPVEVTEHGEIKTSTLSLIMRDQIEGTTLNTNIWTPTTGGGMTISQAGSFLTLNAANTGDRHPGGNHRPVLPAAPRSG
jgi:hypothetical protein